MKNLLHAGALALAMLSAVCSPAFAQQDRYGSYADNVNAPCRRLVALTPSDTADLGELPKAIYVGTGGDIAMVGVDANATGAYVSATWKNVPSGSLLPVRPKRILATGTSAADLVGCF